MEKDAPEKSYESAFFEAVLARVGIKSSSSKFLLTGTLIAVVALVAYLDYITGNTPRLRVLYFFPIGIGAIFIGFRFSFLILTSAVIADLIVSFSFGRAFGVSLLSGSLIRFFTYIITAFFVSRIIVQLKIIDDLKKRRDFDLNTAKKLYNTTVVETPDNFKSLKIAAKRIFAVELGGDYYHFSKIGETLFFCIGDISGKGISASLFTVLLHQNVVDLVEKHPKDVCAFVSDLNARLLKYFPEEMYLTFFCAFTDSESMEYVNAGHPPPIVDSRLRKQPLYCQSDGLLPLGMMADIEVSSNSLNLMVEDIFVAVTDGITESPAFLEAPTETLGKIVKENYDKQPNAISDAMVRAALESGSHMPQDDITIICLKKLDTQ